MFNPIHYFRAWRYTRKMLNVQQFADRHKNFLVIVCDPRDDTMFMSYKGKQVANKIKSKEGKQTKTIRNVLRHSTFESNIDRFQSVLIDALRCTSHWYTDFGHWIDGGLFNISKSFKKKD